MDSQIQFIDNVEPDRPTSPGTEIRVHGVGDHAPFSALGRPGFESRRTSQVVISEPPQLPLHRLLLVGWSRANRRLTRTVSWYLLFPFTLLNVAGYMTPRRSGLARMLRVSVRLVSLILTAALAAWITVIVETAWRGVTSTADSGLASLLLCASGPAVVGAVIVKRMVGRDAGLNQSGRLCSIAHLTALGLLAVTCFFHPADWHYATDGRPQWWRDAGDSTVDPMAYLLMASTAVVLTVSLTLTAIAVGLRRAARDKWGVRDGSALAAAALILLVATAVLHTAASLIRLVMSEAVGVVQDIRRGAVGQADSVGHMLLPQSEDLAGALRMDLLFGFFGVFVLILGASVVGAAGVNVAARSHTNSATGRQDRGKHPTSSWHSILGYAPACLSFVVLSTVALTAIAWTVMALQLDGMDPGAVSLSRRVISFVVLIVIAFLVVRRPERVGEWIKGIFQMVADIAGFWPPRNVPLAGASYRDILMEALDSAAEQDEEKPIALVGHSQGSVVCAWYIGELDETRRRITLFTCGSPLWSLYATFFPAYFGREFFERVASNSAGSSWYNYWRLTDPIATPVPFAENRDVTEDISATLRGHGEYWREPQMRQEITDALTAVSFDKAQFQASVPKHV